MALTLAGALILTGCQSSGRPAAAPGPTVTATPLTTTPLTTAAGATTPVTAAPPATTATTPPTSVPYTPTDARPTPDAAAAALVSDWSQGQRSAAAAVATPAAVSTLFAAAYPTGYIQDRGCTAASTDPGTCTYRNTQTNGIYEIGVARVAGGWYVTAVTPEG